MCDATDNANYDSTKSPHRGRNQKLRKCVKTGCKNAQTVSMYMHRQESQTTRITKKSTLWPKQSQRTCPHMSCALVRRMPRKRASLNSMHFTPPGFSHQPSNITTAELARGSHLPGKTAQPFIFCSAVRFVLYFFSSQCGRSFA